jgi:hypothetical protein
MLGATIVALSVFAIVGLEFFFGARFVKRAKDVEFEFPRPNVLNTRSVPRCFFGADADFRGAAILSAIGALPTSHTVCATGPG